MTAEIRLWRCPQCAGPLARARSALHCQSCQARYDQIGEIPDFRVARQASWIDIEADRREARRLAEQARSMALEQLVHRAYGLLQPQADQQKIERRTREVLARAEQSRASVRGWLNEYIDDDEAFLDLGCGPGWLLAGAAAEGRNGIGIDASMVGLVVADRLIRAWGGQPVLAAAMGEALPFATATLKTVVALDVIEHVADPAPLLREIDRVTRPGGTVVVATPNRYSLTAEPHVFVLGVGYVPRRWQKSYVKYRVGQPYEFIRLLSSWEIWRLFRAHTRFECTILVPPVPEENIRHFPGRRAQLARLYNRLAAARWSRLLFLMIAPFFHVIGKKAL